MPGPQAIRPKTSPAIQPPTTETTAPAKAKAPASTGQIRDDASAAIHQLRGSAAVRGSSRIGMEQAVGRLAEVYDRGGIHAVNDALRSNPALVAALGGRSRDAVEAALDQQDLSGFEVSSVMGAIQSEVTATLRRSIVTGARDRLAQHLRRIAPARAALAGELAKLGDPPSDPARARELEQGLATLDEVRDNITALQTRFQGQAWEVGDFEQMARRASLRMGMGAGTHDSFVLEALGERSGEAEAYAHYGSIAAELAVEVPHVAHAGFTLSLPFGILAGGLAVGYFIHGAAEEHREEFLGAAHALGVR